jgi:4-hydroxybenzoate polyprenyltransferase
MTGSASDIALGNWVDRLLPRSWRPYARLARLDRPIGIWLLMFPCWWGVALASPGWPDPWFLILFAIGAAVMRGAGCTFNDIVDRDYDRHVARTASRPIPSGAVSVARAAVFMVALALVGLAVLFQFNGTTVALGVASLLIVTAYPFAKRVTYWPQVVLGLAFNWGALLGWTAVEGSLGLPALLLYGAGLMWTLGYDTIYAHQDKADDLLIGVKSTALRLGDNTKPWLAGFYGAAVALALAAGLTAGTSWPFFVLLAVAAGHLAWQVVAVDLNDPKDCLGIFRANRHLGLILFLAIVAGRVVA